MKPPLPLFFATLLFAASARAEVKIDAPWVRATVPAQKATGAFMTLTASTPTRLTGVESPAAEIGEVHEMAMEGNMMLMRRLDNGLELPAGKAVELKPGSHHLMLLGLKQPIKAGDKVPLTLRFTDRNGKTQRVELQVPAQALGAGAAAESGSHQHH